MRIGWEALISSNWSRGVCCSLQTTLPLNSHPRYKCRSPLEAMSSTEYWGPALLQFVLQRFADCFFLSEESHTNFKADLALHEASSFCGRRRSSDMGKCFVNETNAAGESRQDVILQLQVWQELRYFPAQEITFVWPCIVTNFFIIKPTRCTNFTNLFWHETLHVSDSSSVHHQEFIHCTLSNGLCHTDL